MRKIIQKAKESITELRVITRKGDKLYVLFPSLEVPVEMTIKYFEHLKNSGNYNILYDVSLA